MADLPSGTPLAATQSIHRTYLEQATPAWLIDATSARRAQFKDAPAALPDWYKNAAPNERQAVNEKFTAALNAQTPLDKAMALLQDIDTFAEPLLVRALQDQFKVQLDVRATLLQLHKRVEVKQYAITYRTFEVVRLPLLQAAQHNFEASECDADAFLATSGFITQTAADDVKPVATELTVPQFLGLCRSLDIGAQYQRYLNDFLHPTDPVVEQVLRQKFIRARKADLAAAAERALLQKHIEPADYQMITSVINGENHPWMGKKQVWFQDLGLMKKRMTGCVAFYICEQYRYEGDVILYIPHDPHHPLKRYTLTQMRAMFLQRFTERDSPDPGDGSPTQYQRFFSQFVSYGDLPAYCNELNETIPSPDAIAHLAPYAPLVEDALRGFNPFVSIFGIVRDLPPDPPPTKKPNPAPFLNAILLARKGHGMWAANIDLWTYLFDQYRDKALNDARSHAVPTANVDARVRSEKFAKLLSVGLLALNVVSMFVPVLGEVMLVVMAGQLLYTTLEGTIEWSEGDRRVAKAHLVDVAENLALIAAMAVGGKVLPKLIAAKPEPLIEDLDAVALPSGEQRLWRSDLAGYESTVKLPSDAVPNALGEYQVGEKSYIRQAGKVYEKQLDKSLNRWRIEHPTDTQAYKPLLNHNGTGAWRHSLERPQTWDRTTLMRRMGPVVDGFSDEQLLKIADISGTPDGALRKMHVDHALPPPALADVMRLFKADQDVAHVIEQISTGQAVDERYLYTLALVTEMPRWPLGRLLEVFDGPGFTGKSQRYGMERVFAGVKLKPPIRISRADVVGSKLPAHILSALDESEVVGLLGGEPARVRENRPLEFRKQLADYARSRQPALFDSLYKGREVPVPLVAKLQRLYPGLSEHAAQSVLAESDIDSLTRLHTTGRVPLAMEEQARWYVRQGRLGRAYAGLHMENMVSADSKRLALHTLSKLPGWSDQVRLENREGSIEGALLDSIGSEDAPQRKYLVKTGPMYQAFNERGETLNSLPRHGDNFYASILHALPDEARKALQLPHVGQSLDLRRAIIDYAGTHRVESMQILEGAPARQSWFKPPQRITQKLVGYPASGEGEAGVSPLAIRAQALYPDMTEQQAAGFVLEQRRTGKSDEQILALLEGRRAQWDELDRTLTDWAGPGSNDAWSLLSAPIFSRNRIARALRRCWQSGPLPELETHASLVLTGDVTLPPLSADFSHVRELVVGGRGLIEGDGAHILGYFPELQSLTVSAGDSPLHTVLEEVTSLRGLTSLHIESRTGLNALEQTRLEALEHLQELKLNFSIGFSRALNVSRMPRLRSLSLLGGGHFAFPEGVFDLADLRRLDLKNVNIDELPLELFEPNRERLWSGLSLNWSRMPRERFKMAYDYVNRHAEHVMDLDGMVKDYCAGQFLHRLGRPYISSLSNTQTLISAFLARWPTAVARFDAMEALSAEYAELSLELETWAARHPERMERFSRAAIDNALRATWYQGLWERYGFNQSWPLELPDTLVTELPTLPAQGFAHVKALNISGAKTPTAPLSAFVRGFSGLRRLDASNCGLTELSVAPGEWPLLEYLDLSDNPLHALDVSDRAQLKALSLRGSRLQTWPTGAEHLAHLTWLDLGGTALTALPEAVLADDRMVMTTHLAGAPLTREAQAAFATARTRIEHTAGLPDGALSRFEQEALPRLFPPAETAASLAHELLPLLATDAAADTLSLEQQLQRLHPQLGSEGAGQWLERLRGEGLSDPQVRAHINGWEQTFEALTRRLNGWLFKRPFDLGHEKVVTAQARKIAAEKLLASWRASVLGVPEGAGRELNFHGLILGDLPELPSVLEHVQTLNLNGVWLSEQGSNGFLRAFPQLRTLILSSNPLVTLPEAVAGMTELRRFELAGTAISNPELLYPTLNRLEHLQWLELGFCELNTFRINSRSRLQTLNLNNNNLTSWPLGALQTPSLQTLDLSSNLIDSIPHGALEGQHDRLMAGTNLADNFDLPLSDLQRLQAYAARTGRAPALGFDSEPLQRLIDDIEFPFDSDDEGQSDNSVGSFSAEEQEPLHSDEEILGARTGAVYREPWIQNLSAQEQANRSVLWDRLAAEPGHEAFFNLIYRLQETTDFSLARSALTRRVWDVMEAAGGDESLRETLFLAATTHATCVDGRILAFSGMEVSVYVSNTLSHIHPGDMVLKGRELWKLSVRLFFRDALENMALGLNTDANRAERTLLKIADLDDEVERRLKLLISFKDELDLPGVPEKMRYATLLEGEPMTTKAAQLRARVQTDPFYQNLVLREHWADYLKERFPEEFEALEQRQEAKREDFAIKHPDHEAASFPQASEEMLFDQQRDDITTRISLSKRVEAELNLTLADLKKPRAGGTSDTPK